MVYAAAFLLIFSLLQRAVGSTVNRMRQTAPAIPNGWTYKGCYTDSVNSRTLRTASTTSVDSMTIPFCINFCISSGFNFAGLEFGRECYCDNTIHPPAGMQPDTDCNIACTGDTTTVCGAADRLSVYSVPVASTTTTTQPTTPPSLPIAFLPSNFQYQGCLVDPINPRGLQHQVTVPGGNTPVGCANACRANGYKVMGLEFGGECWCDDYMPYGLVVKDSQCNMPCAGDPTQACGAGARLQLYGDLSKLSSRPPSTQCLGGGRDSSQYSNFQMRGVTNQGDTIKVGGLMLNPGAESEQTYILTAGGGPSCPECTAFQFFQFFNNQLIPYGIEGSPVAIRATEGESQFFYALSSQQAFSGYCTGFLGTNNLPYYGFPVLDQTDGSSNSWGLCLNNTAGGRRDAVYAPIQNHPHYDFFSCIFVQMQMFIPDASFL